LNLACVKADVHTKKRPGGSTIHTGRCSCTSSQQTQPKFNRLADYLLLITDY